MGLFDWWTGKSNKVQVADDIIWLTQEAKSAGIRRAVAQAISNPATACVIVTAHFNDCLERLGQSVAELKRDRVFVTLANALAGRTPTDMTADESSSVLIVVGERHPLPSHDESVVDFARSLSCRSRIVYHLSLEDAVLRKFSGEWVENVLRSLGMKEDEAIESRLVARRIRSALEKIAAKATSDLPAISAEDWLTRNCPGF